MRLRNESRQELADIEVKTARVALQIRLAKLSELAGDVVSAASARAEWCAGLAVLADGVLSLPRKFKPALPTKIADNFTSEFERFLRMELEQLSQTRLDTIKDRLNHNGKPHG